MWSPFILRKIVSRNKLCLGCSLPQSVLFAGNFFLIFSVAISETKKKIKTFETDFTLFQSFIFVAVSKWLRINIVTKLLTGYYHHHKY